MTKRNTKAVAKPYTPTPEESEKVELRVHPAQVPTTVAGVEAPDQ